MQVKQILTHTVETVSPDTRIQEVARKMKEFDIGAVPVCSGRRLLGLITDRDIAVRTIAEGRDPSQMPVSEAMTEEVIFCYEDQDVEVARRLMEQYRIRRLPVVDEQDQLVGIVSIGDLALLAEDEEASTRNLRKDSEPRP
ncbi:MAG: CBS domain-containing protein [FCB group bacterium]|jgi:CBS domain-containing protein|nr:CBS domain-containing protein [FCB group bacterium]